MFPIFLNPLPILLTLSTAFGVLVHDTRLDQVAAVATLPAIVVGYNILDYGLKLNEHIHTERASFGMHDSAPTTQPRNEDRKYIAQKKFTSHAYGSEYQWPSN